jgi:hypothetical protein
VLGNTLVSRHITADVVARPSPRDSVTKPGEKRSTVDLGREGVDVQISRTEKLAEAEVLAPARLLSAEEDQVIPEPSFGG